MLVCRYLVKSI